MTIVTSKAAVQNVLGKLPIPGKVKKYRGGFTAMVVEGSHKKGSLVVTGPYNRKMILLLMYGPKILSV